MFAGGLFVYVGTAEKWKRMGSDTNGTKLSPICKRMGSDTMQKNGVGHDISGIIRTLSSQ